MYKRLIKAQIEDKFFQGKIIILTGARQVGKTTLALDIIKNLGQEDRTITLNCDNPGDRDILNNRDIDFLAKVIGESKVVFIDEGQKVETIGQTLKLLADFYKKEKQIIVTGSSSFNLLDKTQEALTGRKFIFHLFGLGLEEIHPDKNPQSISKSIESLMIYGTYPEIVSS
jgi:predicted AAA+ superfamily ATPase